jgi:hypothetical protein
MNTKVILMFGDGILFTHFLKTLFKFVPQRFLVMGWGCQKKKQKKQKVSNGAPSYVW